MSMLGVAVLGTAVLGVAMLGTAVLHPQLAFIHAALPHAPLSTTHEKRNHGAETETTSMPIGPAECDTLVYPCLVSLCSASP